MEIALNMQNVAKGWIEMSDKLLPCPFCGGESTQREMTEPFRNGWVGCQECHCFINWIKNGKPQAISAWNRRATQPNEPLTLKEVSQYITGQPILLSTIDGSHTEWKIVEGFDFDEEHDQICYTDGQHSKLSTYGKTWLAYRTKQKVDAI